jgi:hypothetical protein
MLAFGIGAAPGFIRVPCCSVRAGVTGGLSDERQAGAARRKSAMGMRIAGTHLGDDAAVRQFLIPCSLVEVILEMHQKGGRR